MKNKSKKTKPNNIQYQLIYKVKNDFSEDFIQFENGDYILEVEYLREIKKIK